MTVSPLSYKLKSSIKFGSWSLTSIVFAFIISLLMHFDYYELLSREPLKIIFIVAAVLSFWSQLSVFKFFEDSGFLKNVELTKNYRIFGSEVFPYLSGATLIIAIVGVENFYAHIGATVAYFLLLSVWDYAYAHSILDSSDGTSSVLKHDKFKKYCNQLFYKIDGLSFAILLVWFLIFVFFNIYDSDESWSAAFFKDYRLYKPRTGNIKSVFAYPVTDLIATGMFCFHLFFTIFTLFIYLKEWDKENRN